MSSNYPSSHDQQQSHTATLEESTSTAEPDHFETIHGTVDTCTCLECGTSVPSQVGRVYGDNHDRVKACKVCWTDANGYHSASTHATAAMHAITEAKR